MILKIKYCDLPKILIIEIIQLFEITHSKRFIKKVYHMTKNTQKNVVLF